jgi:hypothetical protein
MDLEVLEVLVGASHVSPLRAWGDDGGLCRPPVASFPVGSEWVIALDGPGAKPAMSPGRAISICGEYSLRVDEGIVRGAVEAGAAQGEVQSLPLAELRARLAAPLATAAVPARTGRASFAGEVRAGEAFERSFGPGFRFRLEPSLLGWEICVHAAGRDDNLARLTPPFHSVPNPRFLEGWHFRNADNSGPNEPGPLNVNAPQEVRVFVFSPEVGRSVDHPVTAEQLDAVRRWGSGELRVVDSRLERLEPGDRAAFSWLRFEVELTWDEDPAG